MMKPEKLTNFERVREIKNRFSDMKVQIKSLDHIAAQFKNENQDKQKEIEDLKKKLAKFDNQSGKR